LDSDIRDTINQMVYLSSDINLSCCMISAAYIKCYQKSQVLVVLENRCNNISFVDHPTEGSYVLWLITQSLYILPS